MKYIPLIICATIIFGLLFTIPPSASISNQTDTQPTRTTVEKGLSSAWCVIEGDKGRIHSGSFSMGSGDVNGDEFDDIIISAMTQSPAGYAYLTFGRGAGLPEHSIQKEADVMFAGETFGGVRFGKASIAGDINNDGYDDILATDSIFSATGNNRGKVYLFFGRSGQWNENINANQSDASFIGLKNFDSAGSMAVGVGDVNNDDYDDFMIGAFGHDTKEHEDAGMIYLIFGGSTGWQNNMVLGPQLVSYHGNATKEMIGWPGTAAGVGDVNGDGIDDILIGSRYSCNLSISSKVESYLILGREEGWEKKGNIDSNCDASFIGDPITDQHSMLGGKGDINNDGFDDILIGANQSNNLNGTVHLFFGKEELWGQDTNVEIADRIYHGQNEDRAGTTVTIFGDMNLDGYDDIAIGAPYHDHYKKHNGCIYILYGNSSDWRGNMSLAYSDFLYYGEGTYELPGGVHSLSPAGDINGDGFCEIKVSSIHYPRTGPNNSRCRGRTYIISPHRAAEQISTYSVDLFLNESLSIPITQAMVGDRIYVKLEGEDGDPTHRDQAFVNVITDAHMSVLPLMLTETGENTGTYIGNTSLGSIIDTLVPTFNTISWVNITVYARKHPSINSTIFVKDWVTIFPRIDNSEVVENEIFNEQYFSRSISDQLQWNVDLGEAHSWLSWDEGSQELHGSPDNRHVGYYQISINLSDGDEHFDKHEFCIHVKNKPPKILTENIDITFENCPYFVDYNCDQDGLGDITWSMKTDLENFNIDTETGILTGLPTSDQLGDANITIIVNDGNDGWDWTSFILKIGDVNDPPMIITDDELIAYEDDYYCRSYNAYDIDIEDTFAWSLNTNASWMSLDQDLITLYGFPSNDDVGFTYVNISVVDNRGGSDFHNFTLEVINVNDPPIWEDTIEMLSVIEGEIITHQFQAIDPDIDDVISYSIASFPEIDLNVDISTGEISWLASSEGLSRTLDGNFSTTLTISASDGGLSIQQDVHLVVTPNSYPSTMLLFPLDGSSIRRSDIVLRWMGSDPEEDVFSIDIYLDPDLSKVLILDPLIKVSSDLDIEYFTPGELEIGETYFWTVIPKDSHSQGLCNSGVFKFHVNTPPMINNPGNRILDVGKEMNFVISGSDQDPMDSNSLIFSLVRSPDGMTISEDSGRIRWTPKNNDVGDHQITVAISDNKDTTNTSFNLIVSESISDTTDPSDDLNGTSDSGVILIIISSILVLMIPIVIIYMFKSRSSTSSESGVCTRFKESDEIQKPKMGKAANAEAEMAPMKNEVISLDIETAPDTKDSN